MTMDGAVQSGGATERWRPRTVVQRDNWDVGHLGLKVYGILAEGRDLTAAVMDEAQSFVARELPRRALSEGEDNGLGFVIIHPGELGLSVLGHWWMQGSVLCQAIHRRLWGAEEPMDTAVRPVIACVWELAVIDAEQRIWRDTMMGPRPDAVAYRATRATMTAV